MTKQELLGYQKALRGIMMDQDTYRYAVRLARASRPGKGALAEVNQYVHFGAGPRASQYLSIGARVRAGLDGRPNADKKDVAAVARAVLQHRMVRNFRAEAEGVSAQDLVDILLRAVS
jgi:MoxR-like ATPase